jgi:predicted small secreted protein
MTKQLLIALAGLIAGVIIGVAVTIVIYPFIFPPPEVNEQISNIKSKRIIASGSFIHPNPNDPVHWGKGGISIYLGVNTIEIFLERDFEVGPGPAYHVYLSAGNHINNNDKFITAENMDIGKLKSFRGSQIYNAPADVNLSKINSVVIWCKTFNQLISSAEITHN